MGLEMKSRRLRVSISGSSQGNTFPAPELTDNSCLYLMKASGKLLKTE